MRKRKPSQAVSGIAAVLILLAGIALILYPTAANKINNAVNRKAIGEYQKQLLTLDNDKYEKMLRAAQDYNARLFRSDPYIGALTAGQRMEYESLLDIDGSGMMGYIEVPKSKIYLAIYHSTDEAVLQTGAGHLESSSLPVPGASVHTVLSGHSGLPSARLFTDLDRLRIGDTFTVHILRETLTYRVERMERVAPDELKNLRIEQGQELCTLMTCTPYGVNTHRLVITGRRIETPVEGSPDETPIAQAVASKWNRRFVFLPAGLFAGIVVAIILIRKSRKKNKQPRAERREEDTRL